MLDKDSLLAKNRGSYRLPIELLVKLKGIDMTAEEFCSNLSSDGIFIETRNILPVGANIEVMFSLPHNHVTFLINGRVKWSKPIGDQGGRAGMGIMFEDLRSEERSALSAAIQFYQTLT
jgi:uncharacterized protein (TIGR02266 family)